MIKKLSLAAIVAMGSMTAASAADLSNAIKGMNAAGYLRYRYTSVTGEEGNNNNINEYKAVLRLTKKIDENMKITAGVVAVNKTNEEDGSTSNPVNLNRLYLQYSKAGADLKAGQIDINTPLTADDASDYGTGTIASYKVCDAFTPIVAAFSTEESASTTLYVAAAKGSVAPASYQFFYYKVNGEVKAATFTELKASVAGQTIIAQYATKNYDSKSASYDEGAQSFGALALAGKAANVSYTGAYLHFGNNGAAVNVGSYASGLIHAGELTSDIITGYGPEKLDHLGFNASALKGNALAAVVSANVANITLGMDLVGARFKTTDNNTKVNWSEYTFRAAKAYNKQLKFSTYYTMANLKADGSDTQKFHKLRFEAKYSF